MRWILLISFMLLSFSASAEDIICNGHFLPPNLLLRASDTPNYLSAHGAISSDLYNGEIVEILPFSENNNAGKLFKTRLKSQDPYTGEVRYREAIFKPRPYGDWDGWARSPMEYVAYFLNQKLGMDYIPPTAYRKGLSLFVDGQTYTEGAFVFKVPEYKALAQLTDESFPAKHIEIIADHRVLSVLLKNKDGHHKNLGMAEHWVDGKYRPIFLDWNASFRHGTNVSMTDYPVFGNSAPVSHVRRATFEALKKLKYDDLKVLVETGFINHDELLGILSTRDSIVNYFQGLVDAAVNSGRSANEILLKD